MRRAAVVLSAVALAQLTACTHLKANPAGLTLMLKDAPGGYVTGEVLGVQERVVLDNRDFIYALALSPVGDVAAYTHLAGKTINLAVWEIPEVPPEDLGKPRSDAPLNEYQYDVEGADFSPDGRTLVTAGRDGAVRFFDAATGAAQGAYLAEEPLVTVAFSQDGQHVIAGSANGLLLVLRASDRAFESEVRAHRDEVRAIAVAPEGTLYVGSWDKTVSMHALGEAPVAVNELHLPIAQTPEKVAVVRAAVAGRTGVFAFDAAQPHVVVSTELARAAGIQESLLTETVRVNGNDAKLARGQSVTLKQLTIEGLDVAVCGNCLQKGTDGILGAPVLNRFDLSSAPGGAQLVLVAKQKQDPSTLPKTTALKETKRYTFDGVVNDITIDRAGRRLGVALSWDKAERNREVYLREKNKEKAPFHQEDSAAIVDAQSGQLLARWHKHEGVVATAGISPDGKTLASGGWDNQVHLWREGEPEPKATLEFDWIVRRVRFSRDGRLLAVGAWTPQNALGDQQSEPSAVIYDVAYKSPEVAR